MGLVWVVVLVLRECEGDEWRWLEFHVRIGERTGSERHIDGLHRYVTTLLQLQMDVRESPTTIFAIMHILTLHQR